MTETEASPPPEPTPASAAPSGTQRPRRRARWVFLTLLGILLLAGVAYGGWWVYLANRVESAVQQWARANRAHGASVDYELEVHGFPGQLEAVARDFDFRRPDGWSWHGPRLVVRTKPWQVQIIDMAFEGRHRLSLPGRAGLPMVVAFEGGQGQLGLTQTGALTTGHLTLATLALAQTSPAEALAGEMASATFGDAATLGIRSVRADLFQAPEPVPDTEQAGAELELTAADVVLPRGLDTPLGNVITEVSLGVRLMGLPTAFAPAEMRRWTAEGGQVRLDRFALDWGPLGLKAQGFVSLDPDLQYVGKIDAEIRGLPETIDALVEAGLIARQRGAMLKAFAKGLAAGSEDPETPVKLPLVIGNGYLQFGPFKLVALPGPLFG